MNNITKGALIGSAAAVSTAAIVSAVSYSVTHSLIKIAFERDLGITPSVRTKQLFSGCKQMAEIERFCTENAVKLDNGCCKKVELCGRGRQRLVGHFHASDTPKRNIIAMHGWRTTWARDFGAVSEFWHKNGCNVLYAEQRGQNNSEGEYIGFGIAERYDCLDWVKWICAQSACQGLPVYLCGVSMGAATVLMATGLSLPENVKGVIADCGFTSPHSVFKHVVNKNLHFPYGAYTQRKIDRLCRQKHWPDPHSYSTVEAMKSCKVPVMFVHGTDDRFVPIQMTYDNYRACAAPKRMFIVPGAEHGMAYFTDKQGYEYEMLRFFSDCETGALNKTAR